MYHLLIIDDEPIVRDGIKVLLPWTDYGFHSIADASDGKSGIKRILELSPDLVLVDIKMPGMTGLEVIKEAKEKGFHGKFIILTGHSDFEFAKTAISLGVRAYLLKPIDEEELRLNVVDIIKDIDAKRNLDDYLSINEIKAKKELLRRMLLTISEKSLIDREIKQYGLDFHYTKYCVAILSPKRSSEYREESIIFEEEFEKEFRGDIEKVYLEEKQVIIGKGYTYIKLEEKLALYNEKVKNIKGGGLFITIGHHVAGWWDIHYSYECAKMLASHQFLFEEDGIINITTIEEMERIDNGETFDEELMDYIEIGGFTEINRVLDKMKAYYKTQLLKEAEVKVKITQNILTIHNNVKRKYESRAEYLPSIYEVLKLIKNSYTLHEIMNGIHQYCYGVGEVIGSSSTDNVVKRMLSYMEKNYNKDLKLEAIAKIFNYNSAYLGQIFKKYKGDSFNNTLDIIRINNAKKLLEETEFKVYQISEQVGFSNIDYFYSKFKKYVGISPKEYKRR